MDARLACCLALAACHVTSQSEIRRPRELQRIEHPEGATPRHPTLVLTDAGVFRFVEPLECPTEEVITESRTIERVRGPNLATFVVGVIASAIGGVMLVRGLNDDEGASSPFTYAGAGLTAVGLPFAIGPWIGNGMEVEMLADSPATRRPGLARPCGERPLAARSATLTVRGIEVFGLVDDNGVFAVSPFAISDAFEAKTATTAWNISAKVDVLSGARTVEVVIDARTIAAHADRFLASGSFDPKIEALRLVPGIVVGAFRAGIVKGTRHHAARVSVALKNDGPGPAHALRGHVVAPGAPALDGRILYFGHVAKGATVSRDFMIPVSASAADALAGATVDLALELRDAHGTAPPTPIRHRGPIVGAP